MLPEHVLSIAASSEESVAALAATALLTGDGVRLTVLGRSMMPVLWPGATVEIERCDEGAVARGELVLCRVEGGMRLHRVRRMEGRTPVTQGDGCNAPDGAPGEVLGRARGLCAGRWQWVSCPPSVVRAVRSAVLPALPWLRRGYRLGLVATAPLRRLAGDLIPADQDASIEPLAEPMIPRLAAFLRRNGVRPTAAVLESWRGSMESGKAFVALAGGAVVGAARAIDDAEPEIRVSRPRRSVRLARALAGRVTDPDRSPPSERPVLRSGAWKRRSRPSTAQPT